MPAELTTAVAAAETVEIPVNVICGGEVYPEPPFVTVTIPITPFQIVVVAADPTPSPKNATPGATVYP